MAKKPRPKRTSKSSTAHPPPRLSMDKAMHDLRKILESQNFESIDDANAFLRQLLSEGGGRLPELPPETPLEQAQALIYQAHEERSPKRRAALARRALEISPDCAEAYDLLSSLEPDVTQRLALLEQGVAAGRRAIGEENFAEWTGHFWGMVETRPFMRCYVGLAELSWIAFRDRARAIEIFQDMLRLNPGDNQGVRYMLSSCLLEERTPAALPALVKLFKDYGDDASANWAYNRALMLYQQRSRPSEAANRALRDSFESNAYVPPLLLGQRPMPKHLPEYIGRGDENEAVEYVAFAAKAWHTTPGAIEWLEATGEASA